jgi:hypothetical protein
MGKRRANIGRFKKGHKFLPSKSAPDGTAFLPTGNIFCVDQSQDQVHCYRKPVLQLQTCLQINNNSDTLLGNRVNNLNKQKLGLGSRLQFQCTSCKFIISKMETFT